MFCSECGTKNKKKSLFCENCGHKMEENNSVETEKVIEVSKKDEIKVESKKETENKKVQVKETNEQKKEIIKKDNNEVENEVKQNNVESIKPKNKKHIGLYILIVIIAALVGCYLYFSNLFSPKKVAEEYFNALVNADFDKLYEYFDIENSEFTSKKIFKKSLEDGYEKVAIENYSVEKPKSKDGLTSTVKISYILTGKKDTESFEVELIKQKDKKMLIFDSWKVKVDNYDVVKDYKFTLPKGSTLEIEGIKVKDKYLSDNKDMDEYIIPSMFNTSYDIKVKLPMGIEIEDTVFVDNYGSYSPKIDLEKLSEKQINKFEKAIKNSLEDLYDNAKENKSWDSIEDDFDYKNADLANLKKAYENLAKSINSSSTLKSVDFKSIDIKSASINKNGYLLLSFKVVYDYVVEFKSGDETKTNSSNDSDIMDFTYDYVDEEYKLVNASSLNTYFSKYY